jgi:hypothetical protein
MPQRETLQDARQENPAEALRCYFIKPVLPPPIESDEYTLITFAKTLVLEVIAVSIGSAGDAYNNALGHALSLAGGRRVCQLLSACVTSYPCSHSSRSGSSFARTALR